MIDKDVPRVGWPFVDAEIGRQRLASLKMLLEKVSRRLPSYNQGLSFICAFALETFDFQVEPSEFAVLHLLFHHRFHLLLSPRTCFLQQYVDRFDFLFARVLPDLYAKFSKARFDTMFFAMDWFTTFFTNSLSRECCTLVWDVLIIDELEDALFLCGLACLRALEPVFLNEFTSDDQFYLDFKRYVKEQLSVHEFRASLQAVVQVLIPTGLIPKRHSTIAMLESRIEDPNDVLVQIPFDATFLMRAVQSNDFRRAELEITKYAFPVPLLEYALLRAVLLGHAMTVMVLLDRGRVSPRCDSIIDSTMLSPDSLAVHLGHGEVLRCLLYAQHSRNMSGWTSTPTEDGLMDVAKSLRAASGEEDSWYLVNALLNKKVCLKCGSGTHPSQACPSSSATTIVMPTLNANRTWCTKCEFAIKSSKKRRAFTCTRCQNTFCDRCADTFRTVNGRAMRACTTCHHFWGSCSCISSVSKTAKSGATPVVVCDHASLDLINAVGGDAGLPPTSSSVCECDTCMQTFVRLNGKRFFEEEAADFAPRIEARCEQTLTLVTARMRQIGWTFVNAQGPANSNAATG